MGGLSLVEPDTVQLLRNDIQRRMRPGRLFVDLPPQINRCARVTFEKKSTGPDDFILMLHNADGSSKTMDMIRLTLPEDLRQRLYRNSMTWAVKILESDDRDEGAGWGWLDVTSLRAKGAAINQNW